MLESLLSPIVIAFAVGYLAKVFRSELEIPEAFHRSLSIFLLLAIGLKGGAEFRHTPLIELGMPAVVSAVAIIFNLVILRLLGEKFFKLNSEESACLGLHFASVSVVTYLAAVSFAETLGFKISGTMTALVAYLEILGVVLGLMMSPTLAHSGPKLKMALAHSLRSEGVTLLLGGLIIGYISRDAPLLDVKMFFEGGFKGALTLFLLGLGMKAASSLDLVRTKIKVVLGYGILAPLLCSIMAILLVRFTGLNQADSLIFVSLISSASYIAAPAVAAQAFPKVPIGLYLGVSLGVTFPLTVVVGIPFYWYLVKVFA